MDHFSPEEQDESKTVIPVDDGTDNSAIDGLYILDNLKMLLHLTEFFVDSAFLS